MFRSKRRYVIAIALALYLYFLLPATAVVFYELYHFSGLGIVYWGYSLFKTAGHYFGVWEYQLQACVALALTIIFVPSLIQKLRRS